MSELAPVIREDFDKLSPQRFADLLREIGGGALLATLIERGIPGVEVQFARVAQSGASPATITFASLGWNPPVAATECIIMATGPNGDEFVAPASITTTQFAVTGGADTEALQLMFIGRTALVPRRLLAAASNAATLPFASSEVLDVIVRAGTIAAGTRLALKIGPSSMIPASGEVVWGGLGSTSLRFAAADAVTSVEVLFLRSDTPKTNSMFERRLGQRDG